MSTCLFLEIPGSEAQLGSDKSFLFISDRTRSKGFRKKKVDDESRLVDDSVASRVTLFFFFMGINIRYYSENKTAVKLHSA